MKSLPALAQVSEVDRRERAPPGKPDASVPYNRHFATRHPRVAEPGPRLMRFHALIAAAGTGYRFGAELPKQYSPLSGKPVLQHSIDRLASGLPLAMTYVVVAPDDPWFDAAIGAQAGVAVLRCGGATRAASVRNALAAMQGVDDGDWIVVHDAARPCIDRASLRRLHDELADDPVGGILALPVAGTVKRADAANRIVRTEPRAGLWEAQTPQMFHYGLLRDALARPGAEQATDEACAVEWLGAQPRLVHGSATNLKITYPADLRLAAAILDAEEAPA
jgi:2-C-methyl-D-erythritol 4-phosphate cytidylyltransferase